MDIKKLFENTPKDILDKIKHAKSKEEFKEIAQEEAGLTEEQIESIAGGKNYDSCMWVFYEDCDHHCSFEWCDKDFKMGQNY